jgi:hypothetical protein
VFEFRKNLSEAAKLGLQLIKRYDDGEAIDPSYVSMIRYKNLFDALPQMTLRLPKNLPEALEVVLISKRNTTIHLIDVLDTPSNHLYWVYKMRW